MKFLLPLAVVALVCCLTESRIVSKCELKKVLNNALPLPKKLASQREQILAVVTCEVQRLSNFNTNLGGEAGNPTTTTTSGPKNPATAIQMQSTTSSNGGPVVQATTTTTTSGPKNPATAIQMQSTTSSNGGPVATTTALPIGGSTNSGFQNTTQLLVRKKRDTLRKFYNESHSEEFNSTGSQVGEETSFHEMTEDDGHKDHSEEEPREKQKQKGKGRHRRSPSHHSNSTDTSDEDVTEEDESHSEEESQEKHKGKGRHRRHLSKRHENSNSTTTSLPDESVTEGSHVEDDDDHSKHGSHEKKKGKGRHRRSSKDKSKGSKKSEESDESDESDESKEKMKPFGSYGIFQFSDLYCDSGRIGSRNKCQTPCSAFTDDDITDDVACFVKREYWEKLWEKPSPQCKLAAQSYFAGCQ